MCSTMRWLVAALVLLSAGCGASQAAPPDTTRPVDTTIGAESTTTSPATAATDSDRSTMRAVEALGFAGPDNQGTLLGLSTGLTRAERGPRWSQLESDSGRTYDIGHVFHPWDRAIPTEDDPVSYTHLTLPTNRVAWGDRGSPAH